MSAAHPTRTAIPASAAPVPRSRRRMAPMATTQAMLTMRAVRNTARGDMPVTRWVAANR